MNQAFRESFLTYRSATGAYVAFIACYLVCGVVTRLVYQRAEAPAAQPEPVAVSA